MNAVNSKPSVYAINCKKMQSLSLIQCNLMRFLIHKCSQRNCRLSPCTLYKLQWSCRVIHGIAQGILYVSTCERISSTTIIFQHLPKAIWLIHTIWTISNSVLQNMSSPSMPAAKTQHLYYNSWNQKDLAVSLTRNQTCGNSVSKLVYAGG